MPAGVPADDVGRKLPVPPHEDQNVTDSKATASAKGARLRADALALTTIERSSSQNNHGLHTGPFAAGGAGVDSGSTELAVVVTVTVTLTGVAPFAVTEPGVTAHVAAWGTPLQASFTVPAKPGVPARLRA